MIMHPNKVATDERFEKYWNAVTTSPLRQLGLPSSSVKKWMLAEQPVQQDRISIISIILTLLIFIVLKNKMQFASAFEGFL